MTSNRDAIQQMAQAFNAAIGKLPPLPGIYPDYLALIVVIDAHGEREIVLARWGQPSLKADVGSKGATNAGSLQGWDEMMGSQRKPKRGRKQPYPHYTFFFRSIDSTPHWLRFAIQIRSGWLRGILWRN